MPNHYDIIIIGSGAGGGTMARALAATGKEILILERGGFVPREPQNWSTQAVAVEKRYAPGETWYFDNKAFKPGIPTTLSAAAPSCMARASVPATRQAGPPWWPS